MTESAGPIGGFFELELPLGGEPIHPEAVALSTGRSCLLAIIDWLQPRRCFLPYYTCGAAIEPFINRGIDLVFYDLDSEFLPVIEPELEPDECFLITHFWGLEREAMLTWSQRYGRQLIIDDTHDFFSGWRYPESWSFTSARKYFGVPDGAFLYLPKGVPRDEVIPLSTPRFTEISLSHSLHRRLGKQQRAFGEYQAYEQSLPCERYRISEYSESVLRSLDFERVTRIRRENFHYLASQLDSLNCYQREVGLSTTPFVYPLLPKARWDKDSFYRQQIFVPTLWPDILSRDHGTSSQACELAQRMVPIPIDHRYGLPEMQRVVRAALAIGALK